VEEFRNVSLSDIAKAMPILARLRAPLLVHAELPESIKVATEELRDDDPRSYATYLASRPPTAEIDAVKAMIDLARRYNVRTHIVHVAAAEAIPALRDARADRVPITAETCPHYLAFAADEIPDGATQFKCAPPIRDRANREQLWSALVEGVLDCVVSDHSPCPPAMKRPERGDFFAAWGGIASLELTAAVIASQLHARSIPLERMARWMSEAPARLVGLQRFKGRLAAGLHADFALLDDSDTFVVDPETLQQRHHVTPYAGLSLHGRVRATYLRGRLAYRNGELVGPPAGRLLRREGIA
jgi:allantoinase